MKNAIAKLIQLRLQQENNSSECISKLILQLWGQNVKLILNYFSLI